MVKAKKIMLDSSKRGTIVLGFEIDYNELVNSLNHKDVLRIRENVTEPELDIFERFQTGKQTKKDLEKFSTIMEMRK